MVVCLPRPLPRAPWIAAGLDPGLIAGQEVYVQFLSREPAAPGTVSLSEALAFTLDP